jgi:uncharacterized membrane protein SpoIIM required for sporulation
MLMDRDFRRLGDLAAGTLVIYRDPVAAAPELPRHRPIAPPGPITPELQQAVLAFAERSAELSAPRRAELAALADLGDGAEPERDLPRRRTARHRQLDRSRQAGGSSGAPRRSRRGERRTAPSDRRAARGSRRMKQQSFEREYAQVWRRLEALLDAVESTQRPGASVPVHRLPQLLRQVSGHYAMARTRGYSPGLVARLHELIRRGYRQMHRPRPRWLQAMRHFVLAGFPRALRRRSGLFWVACALFFGPMLAMGIGCANHPTLIYSLIDASQVAEFESMYDPAGTRLGRTPSREADDDVMMFGFYVWNNVGIALRTFAWGLAAGVGSVFVLTFNGLFTGAVAGHLTQLGYGTPFWSFVSGHSSLELVAIAIAGAAGLLLSQALLAPGRRSRAAALRANAAEAVPLVLGAVLLLVLAAVVEAFWSANAAIPSELKYTVGVAGWIALAAYLGFAGRGTQSDDVEPPPGAARE